MPQPDNFQLQNVQALRQLAAAIESGTMIITAVNHSIVDGRLNVAIHATGMPAQIRQPTVHEWGSLKWLCHHLPLLKE